MEKLCKIPEFIREGVNKIIDYLAGIFHRWGGGWLPPIRLNNEFFHTKIRALQTDLNGLKHEKNQ